MKAKKPLAVRIFIRICVVAMVVSLVWVYVVYMFGPKQPVENNEWTESVVEEVVDTSMIEILPELDSENPDTTNAPIVEINDSETNEMDQTVTVQLDNGETEVVRLWDLTDAVQIN